MSLLMDALKRAEEAKRQHAHTNPDTAPPAAAIALEPLDSEASGPSLPDLQSHQDAVDKELRDTADHGDLDLALKIRTPEATAERRQTAQNVFAAKAPLVDESQRQKKSILLIIGAGCIAGVAIAGYFWYQLQGISGGSGIARGAGMVPLASAPGPRSAGSLSTAGSSNPPLAKAQLTNSPAAQSQGSPIDAAEKPPTARAVAVRASPTGAQNPSRLPATRSAGAALQRETQERGVSFNVGKPAESTVMRAYAAWRAGDTKTAKALYGEALNGDANHVDALLGLATIAAGEGERGRAESLFFRVLGVDPRNPSAHAGLLALSGSADANQTESRLKTLLAQSNDSSANSTLHFALGNVYAAQQRWNEAQQAYFKAHVGDAENPDYAYNLAISLDRMGQPAVARKYYAAALKLAEHRPSSFDRKLTEARLGQLAP
jgi:tetratricopeptide (TPR) repeat protein